MKRIIVYADFDFLTSPEEIGTLGYEHIRGKDHFVFEYSRQWLKQHGGILLSGDLMNVPSLQHPSWVYITSLFCILPLLFDKTDSFLPTLLVLGYILDNFP